MLNNVWTYDELKTPIRVYLTESQKEQVLKQYEQSFPEKEAETNGLTEIVVAKHRNGATADISLVFEKQYSRFSDYYTGPENQSSGEGLRI